MLAENEYESIFMATDEATALAGFRRRYGERVWTLETVLGHSIPRDRADEAGVRAALADLVTLSRARRIVGTFFSSFSELAGIIGVTPFKRLGGTARMVGADRDYQDYLGED